MAKVGKMSRFNLLLCLLVALSVLSMVSANPGILAAVINCVPLTPCVGTNNNDNINGTNQNDDMKGLGGKDKMFGNDNAAGTLDYMFGGDGNDDINGGHGANFIEGDAGNDRIAGGDGGDTISGGNGSDIIDGGPDVDGLLGAWGKDTLIGGTEDDMLQGSQDNDNLDGGGGNDILLGDGGWAGNTVDRSDFGADIIKGGPGDDKLYHGLYEGSSGGLPTSSDFFKDKLDCGDGNDEAFVNVNTDHDEFINCEIVHKG